MHGHGTEKKVYITPDGHRISFVRLVVKKPGEPVQVDEALVRQYESEAVEDLRQEKARKKTQ